MPQVPSKYCPVVCPYCGEMGPEDRVWTCGCTKYTHYPMRMPRMPNVCRAINRGGGSSSKSKRFGQAKKVVSSFFARYFVEL